MTELDIIALAARGVMPIEYVDRIDCDRFTTEARLFAWTCASRACRLLGRWSNFYAVRWMLATAPRLDIPLEVWALLCSETHDVIDDAERLDAERARQAAARRDT